MADEPTEGWLHIPPNGARWDIPALAKSEHDRIVAEKDAHIANQATALKVLADAVDEHDAEVEFWQNAAGDATARWCRSEAAVAAEQARILAIVDAHDPPRYYSREEARAWIALRKMIRAAILSGPHPDQETNDGA